MKRVLVIDGHAYVREALVELLGNEPGLIVVPAVPTVSPPSSLSISSNPMSS